MRSYLDLVALSARVRRRQSRMIVLTIALSVLLATGIFGMADMFVRSQIISTQKDYGHYHINIRNLTDEQTRLIAARPDVKSAARYDTLNFSGSMDYALNGKPLVIAGADEAYLTKMEPGTITEGRYPQTDSEALIEIGFDEYLGGDRIVLIEWSENAADILPDSYKTVHISYGNAENDRAVTIGEVSA